MDLMVLGYIFSIVLAAALGCTLGWFLACRRVHGEIRVEEIEGAPPKMVLDLRDAPDDILQNHSRIVFRVSHT